MLEQQHAFMLTFHHGHGDAGAAQPSQHCRLRADLRTALGNGAPAVGTAQKQDFGKVAVRQALKALLRNSGKRCDLARKGAHLEAIFRASACAAAVTSDQVMSKWS